MSERVDPTPDELEANRNFNMIQDYHNKLGEWQELIGCSCPSVAAEKIADLKRDAERYRYVRANHIRSSGLHMDGTATYRFLGLLNGRHPSADAAIDAAMNAGNDTKGNA